MTEIASINNNVFRTIGSPLIIPHEQVVTLKSENFSDVTITRDHLYETYQNIEKIKVTLSNRHVIFVSVEMFHSGDASKIISYRSCSMSLQLTYQISSDEQGMSLLNF